MDVDESRHFKNPYLNSQSYDTGETRLTSGDDKKLCHEWEEKISKCIYDLRSRLENGLKNDPAAVSSDYSVYTGAAGIALLYYQIYLKLESSAEDQKRWLTKGLHLLEPALKHPKGKRVTFLCGDSGLFAVGALFYKLLGKEKEAEHLIHLVLSGAAEILEAGACDEVLFGRAGYLYSLLFVEKHFGADAVPKDLINKVVSSIVDSGKALARKERSRCPLMYMWHDSYYLGAAHGLSGIFFMLMRSPGFNQNEEVKRLVKESVDFLVTLRFPSGNYPSSLRSRDRDKLVHWCHGAPGFIHMFIQAYKVFKDEVYLKEAIKCGDVIWERGLLKKGYGLCHGVAGNGYAHLALWQLTGDQKYLFRALKFAEWIFAYGNHGCRIADRPWSLFEGLAGTIYYLIDLLRPAEAEFPAFY